MLNIIRMDFARMMRSKASISLDCDGGLLILTTATMGSEFGSKAAPRTGRRSRIRRRICGKTWECM